MPTYANILYIGHISKTGVHGAKLSSIDLRSGAFAYLQVSCPHTQNLKLHLCFLFLFICMHTDRNLTAKSAFLFLVASFPLAYFFSGCFQTAIDTS